MVHKTIVFGGSGFLGSHVADALSDSGAEVTVFDRQTSPHLRPDQRMQVGDILDPEQVRAALKGQETVYHFAGLADLDTAGTLPMETVTQNIVGTLNLLDAAVATGIHRFVFASTVYVYSERGGFYRCSKQACELYIEEYQRRYGLDFTILRYGSLYGPRAGVGNGIHRFLLQGLKNRTIVYPGTGNETREYIHVKDAAKLSVEILSADHKNKHVIITGHHPMKSLEMLEMIREILQTDIRFEFADSPPMGHYNATPYSFIPKVGHKLVGNLYMDMGQGLLECLHEIYGELNHAVDGNSEGS